MTARLVVIGNGMAGMRCVEEIIRMAPERFAITVFGAEPRPNYNRILLSEILHGERQFEDIVLHSLEWYEQHQIRLFMGETVTLIDSARRTVRTASGLEVGYDVLIVATGSVPYIPPLPGSDKKGVIAFRTLDDCDRMTEYAQRYRKAAVIGGGLLGLEAARGLVQLGMETYVVHNAPYLMNRQLDEMSAALLRQELEQQGMRFALNRQTIRINGTHRAQGLRFENGERLAADLIVMAVGIRPNVRLAEHSGLAVNRAIIVDDWMRTSVPDVYAVGECAEHRGVSYGLVAPLYEQAKILAAHLCQQPAPPYTGSLPYSQLKISGVQVFSIGDIQSAHSETLVQQYDGVARTYRKITATHGRISGAVLYGNTAEGTALVEMIKQGMSTEQWLERQQAATANGTAHDPAEAAAIALAPHSIVCACNAVSKQHILDAMREHGLQTADEVKQHTRASGSCGGCRPTVEALTRCSIACEQAAASGLSAATPAHPATVTVCDCLPWTQAELREQVLTLTNTLQWKQIFTDTARLWLTASDHFSAGSRYGLAQTQAQAHVYSDPAQTLVPNNHFTSSNDSGDANDRKQAPFRLPESVVQMLAAELITDSEYTGCELCRAAIHYYADVAAMRYTDPISGSLHPSSTAAAASSLDSMHNAYITMPIAQASTASLQSMYTAWQQHILPHPLHIVTEVSGTAVEATVRLADLGIMAAPDGWELYAGGAMEPLQAGELIGEMEQWYDVLTLLDHCLHYYVSTAYYGEAMYEWLERVGLLHVREHVLRRLYEPANTAVTKGVDPDADPMSILQRTM
ncbi:FAD-dependent oxidoreductase [Paenibacillus campi]|uniref:FAD-dependent oxidoreductase n=1 Tax=Paenibacillus campi TaxID=3106031 RepID=UPI002AFE1B3C|nr:FAD-dependent oxidoreductase [Paenibacillus sp. SGZ-1014]